MGRTRSALTTETISRKHLVDAVHQEVGLSRDESARLVEVVIEEVAGELAKGMPVMISSFGSFTVREKAPRMGRNPKTGEAVAISARRVVVFRPSGVLKGQVTRALGDPHRE